MSDEFTHFNSSGQPYMIDVGNKAETNRKAVAKARIFMALSTIEKIKNNSFSKGNVLNVAQIAGILGAKQTSNIIPLCHPLGIDHIDLTFNINYEMQAIDIEAKCSFNGKSGVFETSWKEIRYASFTTTNDNC